MVQTNAVSVASSQQITRPVSAQRTTSRTNPKPSRRTRGLDEIAPFLHQVQKIVAEECAKHETIKTISWYKTWESWMQQNVLNETSMNSVTAIIVPELFYNQQTIKSVVEKYLDEIHPISTYTDITRLSDKLVTWVSWIEVDSFHSVKKKLG